MLVIVGDGDRLQPLVSDEQLQWGRRKVGAVGQGHGRREWEGERAMRRKVGAVVDSLAIEGGMTWCGIVSAHNSEDSSEEYHIFLRSGR